MTDTVYRSLDIRLEDKLIAVQENKKANASFILSSILGKCISEQRHVCLLLTQNTIEHFQNVGRLLGYDLLKYIKEEKAKTVDLMTKITHGITAMNVDDYVRSFFKEVVHSVETLSTKGPTTIMFEDLSHLQDLGLSFKDISMYIKLCNSLTKMYDVRIVINCHVATEKDELLRNLLFHIADLWIIVSALKTGISRNVTGSLEVRRPHNLMSDTIYNKFYHYKLEERNIKVFAPGKDI